MALHPYPTFRRGTFQFAHPASTLATRAPVRPVPVQLAPPSSVESVCKLRGGLEVAQEPQLADTRIRSKNLQTRKRPGSSGDTWFLRNNASISWTGSLRLGLSPTGVRDLPSPNGNLLMQVAIPSLQAKTRRLSQYLTTPLAPT